MISIKVPVKILVTGDLALGKTHIGFAKNQMRILERLMSFQNLKQGSRTVSPFDGVVVECWSSFSLQVIRIHVDQGQQLQGGILKAIRKETKCWCFPCFSFGIIEKVRDASAVGFHVEGEKKEYDVSICQDYSYLLLENFNITAPGWEEYSVGQYVLVSLDVSDVDDTFPNCCVNKLCFFKDPENTEKLQPECFTISPINIAGAMLEWVTTIIS